MPSYNQPKQRKNVESASAQVLEAPFHNPYTFMPFRDSCLERTAPSPLTNEELRYCFTGLLRLKIKTISPLMSCSPMPEDPNAKHKSYPALTLGEDVIVPSTSVRGALRYMMTVIAGAALTNFDDYQFLCQGRDLQLGQGKKQLFLGEIGEHNTLKIGQTSLIDFDELEKTARKCNVRLERPAQGKQIKYLWTSDPIKKSVTRRFFKRDDKKRIMKDRGRRLEEDRTVSITCVESVSMQADAKHSWKLKLSGQPLGGGRSRVDSYKKEGIFKPSGKSIDLAESLIKGYNNRNRHGAFPELKVGMLVWLDVPADIKEIDSSYSIDSIQWARWGKEGKKLRQIIDTHHPNIMPESYVADGKVDIVANLFGQIPQLKEGAAGPFASRIRPENLVFLNCRNKTKKEMLAPLAAPHPGCVAFYRDEDDLDKLSLKNSPLKGYKVYRNTLERGDNAPWKYSVQGVYDNGKLKDGKSQKVSKTAELLNEGAEGYLNISLRSLSEEELALLLALCSVDWRLGGGKPLGLGHCRITSAELVDEELNSVYSVMADESDNIKIADNCLDELRTEWPDSYNATFSELIEDYKPRLEIYQAIQKPVPHLRYPRAVEANQNKDTKAGLTWFSRHASLKKNGTGLEVMLTGGELEKKAGKDSIKAQALPAFNAEKTDGDSLFGYDLFTTENQVNRQRIVLGVKKYEPRGRKISPDSTNTSQNQESRKKQRKLDRN